MTKEEYNEKETTIKTQISNVIQEMKDNQAKYNKLMEKKKTLDSNYNDLILEYMDLDIKEGDYVISTKDYMGLGFKVCGKINKIIYYDQRNETTTIEITGIEYDYFAKKNVAYTAVHNLKYNGQFKQISKNEFENIYANLTENFLKYLK